MLDQNYEKIACVAHLSIRIERGPKMDIVIKRSFYEPVKHQDEVTSMKHFQISLYVVEELVWRVIFQFSRKHD